MSGSSCDPLLSGRDYHGTHHENASFRFAAQVGGERVTWTPYDGLPAIAAITNGRYSAQPEWYRNFQDHEERTRGLDFVEDLALARGVRVRPEPRPSGDGADDRGNRMHAIDGRHGQHRLRDEALSSTDIFASERRRRAFPSVLHRAADTFSRRAGNGQDDRRRLSLVYRLGPRHVHRHPRALHLDRTAGPRPGTSCSPGSEAVSEGMLPNRFPDQATRLEDNSVDASLWYAIAVHDFLTTAATLAVTVGEREVGALRSAVDAILQGYAAGTRYGIRADADGLLACGRTGACSSRGWTPRLATGS